MCKLLETLKNIQNECRKNLGKSCSNCKYSIEVSRDDEGEYVYACSITKHSVLTRYDCDSGDILDLLEGEARDNLKILDDLCISKHREHCFFCPMYDDKRNVCYLYNNIPYYWEFEPRKIEVERIFKKRK